MFKRRDGTSGISGHLYETKLISLLNFRAIHEYAIEEFQLASNVDDIGAFDDICIKAKVEGFDKPIWVFIQAKHKENKERTLRIDLPFYFVSYFKIRQHFSPSNKNLFFKGTFEGAECLFVIYTNARAEFIQSNDSKVQSGFYPVLNDLIDTGGTAKQPNKQPHDIKVLCEVAMKEQMVSLAERIAELIKDDRNFQSLLNNEVVLQFHVILAREVVDVSEIFWLTKEEKEKQETKKEQTKKGQKRRNKIRNNKEETKQSQNESEDITEYREATFRPDFLNVSENLSYYLSIFKHTLFEEILKNRKIESTNIKTLLDECFADPTDATKLSKVIGTVITYNNGLLEMRKQYTEYFTPRLKQVSVSQRTADQALELAAKEILLSPKIKLRVPSAFGNKDIKLRGNDEKKKGRISWLAKHITDLIVKYESSKIVTIDESVHKGLLKFNGGMASAIGNLFVLDDDTKLMKVTDNAKSLGTLAKQLYERINESVANLCEYKFIFKVSTFPKILLEYSENEENLAKDFLDKLIICSNQADEKSVEDILKAEIEENLTLSDSSPAKVDEMFLKYHNEIQNWWKRPNDVSYLSKDSQIFENATSYIIEDPLISSISVPYVRRIKRFNYTFNEDAVKSLNLQNQSTIIVAKNTILSIVKVMQHFNNKDLAALEIEYVVKLSTKKRKALQRELTNTNKRVIIFVCEKIQDSARERKILENLVEAVGNKKAIIITNQLSLQILAGHVNTGHTVHDERNSLIDMSEETKTRVLKLAKVQFQGMEVGLEHLVSGWRIAGTSS